MLNFVFGFIAICFLYGFFKAILGVGIFSSIFDFLKRVFSTFVFVSVVFGSICWGVIALFQHSLVPILMGYNAFVIGAFVGIAITVMIAVVRFIANIIA